MMMYFCIKRTLFYAGKAYSTNLLVYLIHRLTPLVYEYPGNKGLGGKGVWGVECGERKRFFCGGG